MPTIALRRSRLLRHRVVRFARRRVAWGRVAAGAAILVAALALGQLVVVPLLVERAVERYVAASPGRSAQVGRVVFKPFSLSLELEGVSVHEPNAGAALDAERITVNLAAATLFQSSLILDALVIERPTLSIEVLEGDVAATLRAATSWLSALTARPVRVASLELMTGRAQLADPGSDPGRRLEINHLTATASAVATTVPQAAPLDVSLTTSGGASLRFTGAVNVAARELRGTVSLASLQLAEIVGWLE